MKDPKVTKILAELDEALDSIGGNASYNVMHYDLDSENPTITIEFNLNRVDDDNYLGLLSY